MIYDQPIHAMKKKSQPPVTPLPTQPSEIEKTKKRYEVSLDTRKLEIELFWKRSLFFWGFIAAAFVAYATFSGDSPSNHRLSLIVSLFGLTCSYFWVLANKGSKYWQENWEQQVDLIEDEITGPLFKKPATPLNKGWFSARQYSVSKLSISLSYYVTTLWAFLTLRSLLDLPLISDFVHRECLPTLFLEDKIIIIFFFFTIVWIVATRLKARTTK